MEGKWLTWQALPNTENIIDLEDAHKRVRGNDKLFGMLLSRFSEDDNYNQLKANVEAQDFASAAGNAHAVKGVAANMSFKFLQEAALQAEQALRGGGISDDILSSMQEEMDKALAWIKDATA